MIRTACLALLVALLGVGAAIAQAPRMTAAQAREVFLGIDMRGVLVGWEEPFRECVDRKGVTTYWFDGRIDRGKMRIRDDGALCFSYASENYAEEACFFAQPLPQGQYRFTFDGEGQTVFETREVRRVRACPGKDVPVS